MPKKSRDTLNYTMHTKMSMLEGWRRTKASTITLTTSTFRILETLNPFHTFGFTFKQSITWILALITSPLYFFQFYQLKMRVVVKFVYNISSFVRNYNRCHLVEIDIMSTTL